MSRPTSRYSKGELRYLVEGFEVAHARKDTTESGLRAMLGLIDFERALRLLPLELRKVVLVRGMAGLSELSAAQVLQVSERAISHRYADALARLLWTLNGR